MFDEKMEEALPAEKIEKIWHSLTDQFGPFKAQGIIRKTRVMGYDVVYVPCSLKGQPSIARSHLMAKGEFPACIFFPLPETDHDVIYMLF